jgi:hypothetical protein
MTYELVYETPQGDVQGVKLLSFRELVTRILRGATSTGTPVHAYETDEGGNDIRYVWAAGGTYEGGAVPKGGRWLDLTDSERAELLRRRIKP